MPQEPEKKQFFHLLSRSARKKKKSIAKKAASVRIGGSNATPARLGKLASALRKRSGTSQR